MSTDYLRWWIEADAALGLVVDERRDVERMAAESGGRLECEVEDGWVGPFDVVAEIFHSWRQDGTRATWILVRGGQDE